MVKWIWCFFFFNFFFLKASAIMIYCSIKELIMNLYSYVCFIYFLQEPWLFINCNARVRMHISCSSFSCYVFHHFKGSVDSFSYYFFLFLILLICWCWKSVSLCELLAFYCLSIYLEWSSCDRILKMDLEYVIPYVQWMTWAHRNLKLITSQKLIF